jgi:hypothetical protein
MALKSGLLVYYKNSRGRNYRRQVWLASPSQWSVVWRIVVQISTQFLGTNKSMGNRGSLSLP